MALHTPQVEELHDAFAVAQLHHELKIVGIASSFEEAKQLCAQTGNLGYPSFIFPVPLAFVPLGTKFAQASYK